jgi:hypothetical protein
MTYSRPLPPRTGDRINSPTQPEIPSVAIPARLAKFIVNGRARYVRTDQIGEAEETATGLTIEMHGDGGSKLRAWSFEITDKTEIEKAKVALDYLSAAGWIITQD